MDGRLVLVLLVSSALLLRDDLASQTPGDKLARLYAESIINPDQFDSYVSDQSDSFDESFIAYLEGVILGVHAEYKREMAYCESSNTGAKDDCIVGRLALVQRYYWFTSLGAKLANGLSWIETPFGEYYEGEIAKVNELCRRTGECMDPRKLARDNRQTMETSIIQYCRCVTEGLADQCWRPQVGAAAADSAVTLTERGAAAYNLGTKIGFEGAIESWKPASDLFRRAGHLAEGGTLLNRIGEAYRSLGQPDSALVYLRQALPIRRKAEDRGGEGATLNNIGLVYHDLSQLDSALAYYRQALPIERAIGEHLGEGRTLNNIGEVHSGLGQPDSALAYFGRALAVARAVKDRVGEATTLNNIGSVHRGLGQPDSALAYYGQAVSIVSALGHQRGVGATLNNIGLAYHGLGQLDSALAYYGQALSIRREVGDRIGEGTTLNNIGAVHRSLGQPDSALAYYSQALPIAGAVGNRAGEGTTLHSIGRVYHGLGEPDSAFAYYWQALPIRHEAGDRVGEAATLNNIGALYDGLGKPDSALAYYGQALPILRAARHRAGEGPTLGNIGFSYHRLLHEPELRVALAYYDSAAAVGSEIQSHAGSDFNRLVFAELDVRLFEEWSLAWLAIVDEVGNDEVVASALAATERGRSQALLDLIRGSSAEMRPGADLAAEGRRWVEAAIAAGARPVEVR